MPSINKAGNNFLSTIDKFGGKLNLKTNRDKMPKLAQSRMSDDSVSYYRFIENTGLTN